MNISTGDPKCWQNKCLPGDPNYLVGANCVSVLIDHFWREQQLVCYWAWAHGPFSQFLCSGGGICTTLWSINSFHFPLMGWSIVPKNISEDVADGTVATERSLSYFLWFFLPFLSLVLPFSLPFGAWRLAKNNWINKLMKKSNGMHDLCHRQSEKSLFDICSLFFSKLLEKSWTEPEKNRWKNSLVLRNTSESYYCAPKQKQKSWCM